MATGKDLRTAEFTNGGGGASISKAVSHASLLVIFPWMLKSEDTSYGYCEETEPQNVDLRDKSGLRIGWDGSLGF